MITSSSIGLAETPGSGAASPAAGGADGLGLVGRELGRYEEFQAANRLYIRVFGYRDPSFSLNPNLLFALKENGGSAVGVFTPEEELVGFAYGFAARDTAGRDFHYSQSAFVDPAYQGRGIGRQLKYLQRSVAERWGHGSMQWTFDPTLARNGHFNFATLRAIGTDYLADYYGRSYTDRLVVEWPLHSSGDPYQVGRSLPAPALGESSWAEPVERDGAVWIPLPAESETAIAAGLQGPLAETIRAVFADGRVLVDCRRLDYTTYAYLALPRLDGVAAASPTGIAEEEL